MIQREEGPGHLSGPCMEVSHCAVKGDSATSGYVLPLYRRSPGCGAGLHSRD